ncbi:MAG: hypothetical protein AAGK32_00455 [Actinomycetota bacterium]
MRRGLRITLVVVAIVFVVVNLVLILTQEEAGPATDATPSPPRSIPVP